MHHSETPAKQSRSGAGKARRNRVNDTQSRFTVGLHPSVAKQVERYARIVDTSMSQAIGRLVQAGLEAQEGRKRDFFKRLKENFANDDPDQQDRLVDEFRTLILGR